MYNINITLTLFLYKCIQIYLRNLSVTTVFRNECSVSIISLSPFDIESLQQKDTEQNGCQLVLVLLKNVLTTHIVLTTYGTLLRCSHRMAVVMDKMSGLADEVTMLREQLTGRENALTCANTELDSVRRQIEQLNQKYQTTLQKYDSPQ